MLFCFRCAGHQGNESLPLERGAWSLWKTVTLMWKETKGDPFSLAHKFEWNCVSVLHWQAPRDVGRLLMLELWHQHKNKSILIVWINLDWKLEKDFQYQSKLCSRLMIEMANNRVCGCIRFLMKFVAWKMGLWLDVRRDPFQFCIQFLPTS